MSDDIDNDIAPEVPDGAALFPEIPAELGVDPLLLVAIHATVFLAGSTEDIIDPDAADEGVSQIAAYMQRLGGDRLARIEEDIQTLIGYARQQKWPRPLIQSLKYFLSDLEVQEANDTDEDEDE